MTRDTNFKGKKLRSPIGLSMSFSIRGPSQAISTFLRTQILKTIGKMDIPDKMNSYFSSISKKLVDKISALSNPIISGRLVSNKSNAKCQFKVIQVQEIRHALAKVKCAKGFGVDEISSFFLKLALPFVKNCLALLFNTSIETSTLPES